ncbi:MAG: hypothetical protein ICV87_01220 [Gemmatimonadetes bacterium]|nr:hypothetical protein [Gemmatimonadota bacterium]
MQQLQKWANQQMWTTELLPLDAAHVAVAFSGPGGSGGRTHHYTVMDRRGRGVLAAGPTNRLFHPLEAGRVYDAEFKDDGRVLLHVYQFRGPAALAAAHLRSSQP